MKLLRLTATCLPLILIAACSSLRVNHSYDRAFDFNAVKTFEFLPRPANAKEENTLTVKNIRNAITRELRAKGLSESQNADLQIALHGSRKTEVSVQEWGYAYGDRYYYDSFGRTYRGYVGPDYYRYQKGAQVYEYDVGTLIVDFIDAKTKELVWRGSATDVIEEPISAKTIDEAVHKLLEPYPPKPGS